MYYRPDDANSQGAKNYMWMCGIEHEIMTTLLALVLFFNAPLFLALMIPGLNWIIYGIGIIINAIF